MGHLCDSNNLAFSPDGRMVASVSGRSGGERDAGLRVWDIASGREVRRFDYHPEGANFLAYLPDGHAIVTASDYDGLALVWDVSDLADNHERELPDAKTLEILWSDLASDDASRGYRASWALSVDAPFRSSAVVFSVPDRKSGPPTPMSRVCFARSLHLRESAALPHGMS